MTLPFPRSLAALVGAGALLAGCGGTDTGGSAAGGADPASVMPKNAVLYLEGVVRPEGDQEEQVRELLSKVLRTDDPGARLKELIDEGFADEGDGQTFDEDLDPWLGERVAVTVTNLAAEEAGYIVAISTRDADKAADFVAAEAKDDGARERSYADAEFFVEDDGTATGLVEDFVVVSESEADFKKAVDTADAGGLDAVQRFEDALDALPEDRLATFYLDPQLFGDAAAARADDEAAAGVIESAIEGVGAITAFAQATADTATIESRTVLEQGAGADLAALGAGAAPDLLESLPEDAWAAIALGRVGDSLQTGLESVAGGLGSAVLGGQFREQTGLDLQQDLLRWIGDVAVFVRGDGPADLGGGVVIEASDGAAAGQALPRLAAAAGQVLGLDFRDVQLGDADQAYAATLPGAPGPVVLARSGDRVVLALGQQTAQDALNPSATLGDTDRYAQAEEALGDVGPTLFVDAPAAMELVGQAAAGDPDFAMAKPYLDMLGLLAAGAAKDGDVLRHRLTAKLK